MIINDTSGVFRMTPQLGVSLIDDPRIVIYDRNIFIMQATVLSQVWWKICLACSSDIVFQLQVIYKLYTSTDPGQQFWAPFKAGNSIQAQTYYISYNGNTNKVQH